MAEARSSLQQLCRRHYEVPVMILVAGGLLVTGLFLPVLYVRKLVLLKNEYSVVSGIWQMAQENHWFLAFVLFFFSVVFPISKLAVLEVLWFIRLTAPRRRVMLHWLGVLGKWSMLDVFVVAIVVVISKSGKWLNADPRVGLYVFGSAIILSMLLTTYIERLARRADGGVGK